METIFIELAVILVVAFLVSYLVRALKQPVIVGYIIAGIVISPFIIMLGPSQDIISTFSKLGVAFLLFIVGLHMNPKVIREVGASSLFIGLFQMIFTFAIGFIAGYEILGYGLVASFYIGMALAFSSTIIVLKLLSDQGQLDSLYGKMSVGILIIQDVVAILAIMLISSSAAGVHFGTFALKSLIFGGASIVFLLFTGFFVLPGIVRSVARSQELLFLFSITWAFAVAALFSYIGFSIEIGALIAGVILSISPYSTEISSKVRPLRDFFLIIFFIILGFNVQFGEIGSIALAAVVLSLITLLLKPLIVMTLMAIAGYTKRNNFLVGVTMAQVSEFSLIILALGVSLGQISSSLLSMITLTAVITIMLSTYMIIYSKKFYKLMYPFASIFEKRKIKVARKVKRSYDAVLFGYNRIGFSILRSLKQIKKSYLVVDYNPDTIEALTRARIPCLYGDIDDDFLLQDLPLGKLKIAVSTVPDFDANMLLIETIKSANPKAIIILRAHTIKDALELYKAGATYVLTPHFLGGEYVANMIKHDKFSAKGYDLEKEKHIKMLGERIKQGQEHPEIERD